MDNTGDIGHKTQNAVKKKPHTQQKPTSHTQHRENKAMSNTDPTRNRGPF